ncbi:hypothetical protein C0Q70_09840 [Pomacea canaliculata]|uniref:Vps72/YL1 C-terminal domain-containing protein n=1 Tax=Pomacea canaliculata TaxID=400727 RepID=A0A2T7PAZ4_POMCA|nr:hypothetical protein C0Q70_09840 [Pomacea canaliculata]
MASTRKSSRVRTVSGFSPAKRKRPESPSFPLPAPVALSITVEKDVSAAVESVSNQETLTVPGGNTECIAEDTPVEKVSAAIFKDPNFVAKYTDPQTKIRFADAEEFSRVRMLPSDLVTGYLALRKASAPVP